MAEIQTIAALPWVRATRYVAPLREGGSLPALVEADDDGFYVLKFRGAGQGPKSLVAEVVAGELARMLGLAVPQLARVEVDAMLGAAEPDPEIQDLLRASQGVNLGLDFLPGALAFEPAARPHVDPDLAADIVWFDALVTNVDRTPRNPNLLVWHDRLWLIDHGAALYRHHAADDLVAEATRPFPGIAEHVLLPYASSIEDADARLAPRIGRGAIEAVLDLVPEEWLGAADRRGTYVDYLCRRLDEPRLFAREAERARG